MHGPRTSGRFGPVVRPFVVEEVGKCIISIKRLRVVSVAGCTHHGSVLDSPRNRQSSVGFIVDPCYLFGCELHILWRRRSFILEVVKRLKDVPLQVLWIDGRLAGIVALKSKPDLYQVFFIIPDLYTGLWRRSKAWWNPSSRFGVGINVQ